jgi:WD40 repeat protein/tRNA A-37 threonylcarbamoyl transferase component Bud32
MSASPPGDAPGNGRPSPSAAPAEAETLPPAPPPPAAASEACTLPPAPPTQDVPPAPGTVDPHATRAPADAFATRSGLDLPGADEQPSTGGPDVPRVAGYEILGELGRGGMGVVYKARQAKLNRLVALKMILAGGHAGDDERRRFLTEAEAVARLQHPGIVQIHEIGEAGGHPYFSLEFCPGGSLADKLNGTPLPPKEAARVVEALARAIQAAHDAGIVHRDLKPANVLLATDGTPKITDFGLAKKLDAAAGQTATGAIMGTPSYMAPEQAGGKSKEIGPAADVYALGAVLYECLTGRPPFRAATAFDTVLQVVSEEPASVRQLQPGVPADLETVCHRCLQKEPAKRYASAGELAEDLRRFQAGEPIKARPVGSAERAWRWCRRNPLVAGLVAAVVAALLLGTGGATFFAVKAEVRARSEKRAREAADWLTYTAQLSLAQREWQDDDVGHARALLEASNGDLRGWEHAYLRHLCDRKEQTFAGHNGAAYSVCWSPDGKRLASAGTAGKSGEVKIWDLARGQEALCLSGHTDAVRSACWSPDGKYLVSASWEEVKVWDTATGREAFALTGPTHAVHSVCWSPDGKRIAAAGHRSNESRLLVGVVGVWDAATGKQVGSFEGGPQVESMSWSPDGERLALAQGHSLWLIDATAGKQVRSLHGHTDSVTSVCWGPDGKRLASASCDRTVKVWDAATGQEALNFGHAGSVYSVCWSPDGKRLASAGWDGAVKVLDLGSGQETRTLKGHAGSVHSVSWSPDGKRLASAGWDGAVKTWDAARCHEGRTLMGHTGTVNSVCWSPDGKRLASTSSHFDVPTQRGYGEVRVWDAATGQQSLTLKGHINMATSACWSPDGKRLASTSGEPGRPGEVKVWDIVGGQEALSLRGHGLNVTSVCWTPDGKRLASVSPDQTVRVWDAETGRQLLIHRGSTGVVCSVCWSPDGTRLAIASGDQTVKVWDPVSGQETRILKGHTGPVTSVCWSPDGKRLASASFDQAVKVWDTVSGREILTLRGHTGAVNGVCWSPDGMRLASAGGDQTVKVWDAATGQQALTLKGPTGPVSSVCWSPDGKRLASAGGGEIKLWETGDGQ